VLVKRTRGHAWKHSESERHSFSTIQTCTFIISHEHKTTKTPRCGSPVLAVGSVVAGFTRLFTVSTLPARCACTRAIHVVAVSAVLTLAAQTTAGTVSTALAAFTDQQTIALSSQTFACTVSSKLLGFWFYFFLIFVSGPCARLSWPSRQILSAR